MALVARAGEAPASASGRSRGRHLPGWLTAHSPAALVALLTATVYHRTAAGLRSVRTPSDNHLHGPLVPFESLALAWSQRGRLCALPYRGDARGPALVSGPWAVQMLGVRADVLTPQGWSFLLMLYGLSFELLGGPRTRPRLPHRLSRIHAHLPAAADGSPRLRAEGSGRAGGGGGHTVNVSRAVRERERRRVRFWWTTVGSSTTDVAAMRQRMALSGARENRSWGAFVRVGTRPGQGGEPAAVAPLDGLAAAQRRAGG